MATKTDNYISKFAPQSHFFTAPSSIVQVESQAFGPISTDQYRLTSKFTASGGKAFAICKGIALIQPQSNNTDCVNLILRPYTQPIAGLNIKYFIYRGLNKSNFIDGEKVLAAGVGTSDFINQINASFLAFHTATDAENPVPDFLSKYIGYDPANQPDSLKLADFFFKTSEYVNSNGELTETAGTAFELPIVSLGSSLGNFISGECGIDIVLNYGDYELSGTNSEFVFDLAYGRAKEAIIDLTGITDNYQLKLKRENIVQFLDAAAYFGFHCIDGGAVVVDSNGTKVNKKGVDIYNEVISNFYTKNQLYLYIQSDRTRSYNFYENYNITAGGTNSLKIGVSSTTLVESAYNTFDWPLIVNKVPQTHDDINNSLFLQLVTDNNVNAMLYGQVAQIDNAQHNNFIDADNLKLPVDAGSVAASLTKVISISNPAVDLAGSKLNIASFNIILYQGKTYNYVSGQTTDSDGVSTDTLVQPNFFDDVFNLIDATPLLKVSENTDYSVLSLQKLKLINHYYSEKQYGISAIQITIINDVIDTTDVDIPMLNRVTYITESIDVLNSVISASGTVTTDTKSSPSVSGAVVANKSYVLPEPFNYTLESFTDSTQVINGIILNASDGSIPNKIILGLTKAENDSLKALIEANNLENARLLLIDLFQDGSELVSVENILYQKYTVGIAAEVENNQLKLFQPDTPIMVYSLDRKYHFSDGYSKYVKDDVILNLVLDLDLSI